jgi:thiol-disulfide isomerase/thioredoxin
MEEEREKDVKEDSKEWKKVVGGYVPKFLQRPAEDCSVDTSVEMVDTIQDYKRVVVDEKDRIVVVRFFAPWCKSCKAAHPHFKKLVSRHSPKVKFVEVPLTKETAYIHEG